MSRLQIYRRVLPVE